MSWCTVWLEPQVAVITPSVLPPFVDWYGRIAPSSTRMGSVGFTSTVRLYVHWPSHAAVFAVVQLAPASIERYRMELVST